jgi:hypothetical protein
MKLWTLTREMVAKLEAELEVKTRELKALKDTTLEQLWLRDLDAVSEVMHSTTALVFATSMSVLLSLNCCSVMMSCSSVALPCTIFVK